MKFINQSFEIIEQGAGTDGLEQMVERAGRTSYKSENLITPTSAHKFVQNMLNSRHLAVLEFGTVYISVPNAYEDEEVKLCVETLRANPHTRHLDADDMCYITTNWRVLVENGMADIMFAFVTKNNLPTRYHYQRHCVKLVTCRQVTHEIVRHRVLSFVQESTRYCRYSNDKFDSELTYIKMPFMDEEEWNEVPKDTRNFFKRKWSAFKYWLVGQKDPYTMTPAERMLDVLGAIDNTYISLADMKKELAEGEKVQKGKFQAQQLCLMLPSLLKAEICICGFEDEWAHFFALRTSYIKATGAPHFLMSDIADKVYDEFVKRGWAEDRRGVSHE